MISAGIDYGLGTTNIDPATSIRYGVISQHSLCQEALNDSLEPDYGDPSCPECGGSVLSADEVKRSELWTRRMDRAGTRGGFDYACLACRKGLPSEWCFPEEAVDWTVDGGAEYDIQTCLDTDLMVTRSPFYTRGMFCSPCVPGGVSLDSPVDGGARAYCLGHEWFEDGVAPYPVFRVSDDSVVSDAAEEGE